MGIDAAINWIFTYTTFFLRSDSPYMLELEPCLQHVIQHDFITLLNELQPILHSLESC